MKGFKNLKDDQTEVKNRFSFRKLSIGLTTVFLGSIFFLGGEQTVHAAVHTPNNQTTLQDKDATKSNQLTSPQSTVQHALQDTEQNNASTESTKNNDVEHQNGNQQSDDMNNSAQTETDNTHLVIKKPTNANAADQLAVGIAEAKYQAPTGNENPTQNNDIKATITAKVPTGTKSADGKEIYKSVKSDGSTQIEVKNNPITVNVSVDATKAPTLNDSFDIKFDNTGDSDSTGNGINWNVDGFKKNQSQLFGDNGSYQVTYNGDGDFTIKATRVNTGGKFNYDFNFVGAKVSGATPTTLSATVKYDGKKVGEENSIKATIVAVDKSIRHHELAHIFTHGIQPDDGVNDPSNYYPTGQMTDGGYTYSNKSKKLQYVVEWNWGQNTSLNDVSFKQIFSDGQILLPDTIKVFTVPANLLKKTDGSRNDDFNAIYGAWKSDGYSVNEDKDFENYLRSHMYTGTRADVSDSTSIEKFNNAKGENEALPIVKSIQFNEPGKFGTNEGHDWSNSIFLIQMDTLLPVNMPVEWTKPGDGPSSTVTIPTKPKAIVTSDSITGNTSTFTGFNNAGDGYLNPAYFKAQLHFADVTDPTNIIDLNGTRLNLNGRPYNLQTLDGDNEENATDDTEITFDDVRDVIKAEDIVKALEKKGYIFVGASYGNVTSGPFNGSTLYDSSTYDGTKYGKYVFDPSGTGKQFTLNFRHKVTEDKNKKEQKTIDEVICYVDENDPTDNLTTPYISKTITFTRDANVDQVTGTITSWNKWTTGNFKAENNPIIPDYTIDLQSNALSQELNGVNDHLATITSAKVSEITTFGTNKDSTQTEIDDLPLGKTSEIEIIIPYKQNPSNPNPGSKTTPPTSTPTPSNPPKIPTSPKPTTPPTTPKKPTTPPTTPTQKTKTPKTPKVPKNKGPKNPGKPKKPTTSKPRKGRGYKYNTNVHGENINGRNKRNYDSNNRPLGERTGDKTVTPLGTSGRGNTSETITPLGTNTSSGDNAQTTTLRSPKNAEQANSQETTLPETGETNTSRLGLIGLCVALLGSIFGLAYKKRKE